MKKRFSEDQIIGFLREAEAGVAVKELCRRHAFSLLLTNNIGSNSIARHLKCGELLMSALYSTTVTAIGGRNGVATSDDGLLNLKLSLPKGIGGKGDATNPEQLFAAGYAACFGNAVIHVTRNKEKKIKDDDVRVVATVGMSAREGGGFGLGVALKVIIAGVDQTSADAIVAEAHRTCPYSNAVRGNIDVALIVEAC